jgi:hypothetical protein
VTKWFRFYTDAMRNPKVARLSDREFRLWVRLLAVAAENDGAIPPADDLKHMLNARLDHLLAGVEGLISIGLIDRKGNGYEPHNWSKFQYKSDTSTDRVQKHRAQRNVSETPPDTEQIQIQKVTPKGVLANADFDTWWTAYPEKVGKGAARKAWPAARSKASLETLIEGVRRYVASKPVDRSYCNPATWLNEERWDDQRAPPPTPMARGSPQRRTVFDAADELLRQMDNHDARPAEDHSPDQAIGQRVPALVYSRPG